MKVLLWIPVYNQIEDFPKLLEEIKSVPAPAWSQILLINNGSSDGSEEYVRNAGHPFLDIPKNLGVGYSYMRAIEWGLEHNFDIISCIASNGKMLPGELHRLVDPIVKHEADYVTGSRYLEGGESPNLPLFRRIAIPAVNLMTSILARRKVSDATCGYRAFRLDLIRYAEFDWHSDRMHTYGFEYYLFAKALYNKSIRCLQVPVTMRYPDRKRSYSKIRPFRDWFAMLRPWIIARLDGKNFHPDLSRVLHSSH